ncbi:MAG: HPr kinase [Pleurocapsa sp.]
MPLYTAYGLGIDSILTLPELITDANKVDLVIKYDSIAEKPSPINNSPFHYWRNKQEIGLSWQKLGTFLIREGREIIIASVADVEEKNLHPALLGACMAVALHQREYLILHGSAVKIHNRAVAFIGDKGWGKSTMAAALVLRGHQFITDDVLAIDLSGNEPLVFPSFPQLKLCPDAVETMGKNPETLPRIMPQVNKRQYKLNQDFSTRPIPLQTIYLLNKGASLSIDKIPTGKLILPLLAHSYGARFGKKLLALGEAKHFLQCTDLANQVNIYSLKRPSDLSLLTDIVNLVEQHISG